MSIQPATKAVEHLISSYNWYRKTEKTDAIKAYLIKNSKGEGEKVTLASSRKDCAELYVYKGERERERENSNSKTLFCKDCSLGSFKNLSNS